MKLRKFFNKISNRFYRYFGHSDFEKFIILSRSRTGSNLFVSLLHNHPNVICSTEILGRIGNDSEKRRIDSFFCKKKTKIKAVGFKIFYYHPVDKENSNVWETLNGYKKLKVIHLTRNNILETIVSREIAIKSKRWVQLKESREYNFKLRLDPKLVLEEINRTLNYQKEFRDKFKNHQIKEVTYEELVLNRFSVLKETFQFLGLKTHKSNTNLIKQNNKRLSDVLENYDEVINYLEKAKIEKKNFYS